LSIEDWVDAEAFICHQLMKLSVIIRKTTVTVLHCTSDIYQTITSDITP
jgi:hypothetical protein